MMKMLLPRTCMLLLGILFCAAQTPPLSENALKKLSRDGELYVDEEMKRALFGVKQIKETMERREKKHRQLMDSLRHSSDKRKGAVHLVREAESRLLEAEQLCRGSLKTAFEECRPCLEDACRSFYTSTCRRGFSSFSYKVEEFFRGLALQLESSDQVYNQDEESPDQTNSVESQRTEALIDEEVVQADASFSRLWQNVSQLHSCCVAVVQNMQQVFGYTFLAAFNTEVKPAEPSPTQEASSTGFFGTMGLDHVWDSVYDLGRTVVEEFSSITTNIFEETQEMEDFHAESTDTGLLPDSGHSQGRYLCRQLRRQVSECLQLQSQCETCEDALIKECPTMRQLHSELEEIHTLFNASRQQYRERLELVRKHKDDSLTWLRTMQDRYSWVCQLTNSTQAPKNIFAITEVIPQVHVNDNRSREDTRVVVTILDSSPLTLSVPAELAVDDTAFIQYVAQEALALHKQQITGIN